MATNDGFQPDRPPIFLSEPTEEIGRPDVGKAQDIAIISSRILKASIVTAAATAVGIAVLSIENPATLIANVTDWASDKLAPQAEAEPPAQVIQSIAIAGTQDLPTMTTDTPTREEVAAAVEPVEQRQQPAEQRPEPVLQSQEPAEPRQAEIGQPVTEALFKQFQAWADEEEARAKAAAAAQPAPLPVAQEAPAPVRSMRKHRRVRSVQNARAEIRTQRNHRPRAREEQDARAQVPPAADPRLLDPSAQNPPPPTFLQSLGFGNP